MTPINVVGTRTIAFCKFLADNSNIAKHVAIADINTEKANTFNMMFKQNYT